MRYENNAIRCENDRCINDELRVDHVTLVTTGHIRRFCSVECLIESHEHFRDGFFMSPKQEAAAIKRCKEKKLKELQAFDNEETGTLLGTLQQ